MSEPADLPLNVLEPFGAGARQITPLLWGLLWLSVVVVALVAIAVVSGMLVRRQPSTDPSEVRVERSGNGLWWIFGGVGVSTIVLLALTVWMVTTMSGMGLPGTAALSIDVSARQWWWSASYVDAATGDTFVTANEIHIPVGVPVHISLTSPDVIHSFWVPALGGKIDVIPGRINETWLQAEKAGAYRGQCSEFCGLQHAQMGLHILAQPPAEFAKWEQAQQSPTSATPGMATGQAIFVRECGGCHNVRGTDARGTKGPDLTHVMSRSTIAAGILENTIGNLAGWIAHPQGIKPGALMPDVKLSGPEFQFVLAYVETLK